MLENLAVQKLNSIDPVVSLICLDNSSVTKTQFHGVSQSHKIDKNDSILFIIVDYLCVQNISSIESLFGGQNKSKRKPKYLPKATGIELVT